MFLLQILYLKNLPKHINDTDLNELFSKFGSNNLLSFRIMTGKMRGQAFVTFPGETRKLITSPVF